MSSMPESGAAPGKRAPSSQAEAVRVADLRLEQWYRTRGLDLPLEVQAEFNAMAFEAIAADPARAPDAVMDELIADLDRRLGAIKSEGREDSGTAGGERPGMLQRIKRAFGR